MPIYIIWFILLVVFTFFLYPRKLVRDPAFAPIYLKKGIMSLVLSCLGIIGILCSWFGTSAFAHTATNAYGGAAVFGLMFVFMWPMLFIFVFAFGLRGAKFIAEALSSRKVIK